MEQAQKVDIKKGLLPESKRQAAATSKYDAYIDVVLKELAENGDEKALEEGISVYTNLDITAQKSVEKGYGGFIYFEAKNNDLIHHYHDAFGAKIIGGVHQYRMVIDEECAQELLDYIQVKALHAI